MSSPVNVAQSAFVRFTEQDPTADDVELVKETLVALARNPQTGVPLPFVPKTFPETYVSWTPNRKWRIVFQARRPDGIEVLSIEPARI